MEQLIFQISRVNIPVFIHVLEHPKRKRVTVKVVKNPTPIPYTPSDFETIRSTYTSRGWVVTESARNSSVYVLELTSGCGADKRMVENNGGDNPRGYLYVGMTGLDPEERLKNHLSGVKSCSLVKDYFQGKFGSMGGMFHHEAEFIEGYIPDVLRNMGYWVYQR
jgi:hypothetical protein